MINPGTILIVQIGKLGDMILTTPLFREIKKIYPDSFLTVLASDKNKIIAENDPHVDKVLVYGKTAQSIFLLYFSSLKKQDLWIDTKNNFSRTSALLPRIFKPKFSLGYNFAKTVFNIDLKNYQTGDHATDINLSPIKYFTNNNYELNNRPDIVIPSDVKKKIDKLFDSENEVKKIILNLSAGDESRYFDKEKWVEFIERIGNKKNFGIYLIGIEKDKEIIDYVIEKTKNVKVKFLRTENIIETAEVISKGCLIISPDTSIIHICSAFNIPVIGIYPDVAWNLEKFYPLSEKKEIIISGNRNNISDVNSDQIVDSFDRLYKELI